MIFKKCFTILLALIFLFLIASAASAKEKPHTPPDDNEARTIFFATDVHGRTDNLSYILENVKSDNDVGLFAFGGDYEVSVDTINSMIDEHFPNAKTLYGMGNHDYGSDYMPTGEAFKNDHFSVFSIAYEDFNSDYANAELRTYLENYNSDESTAGKPLFIISHLPLHEDRGDNYYGSDYAETLNEYGDSIDIFYIWGHNHTVDRSLHFVTHGEPMTPASGYEQTINFTYATAGYIKEGYGMIINVNDETVDIQRYDTYGTYEDTVSIPRIVPAVKHYDCNKDGHIGSDPKFNKQAKANEIVCTECNESYYERLCGDIDGDGLITTADARLAFRANADIITLDSTAHVAADTDNDKTISKTDAENILKYVVGIIVDNIEWGTIAVDSTGNLI